ncbi:MAG: DUF2309 domain-containing protein [Schlesneria sp.]
MTTAIATEKPPRDLDVLELPNMNSDQRDVADTSFTEILADIERILSPVWPLNDYVAVNPYMGLSDQKFLDAQQTLSSVRDCRLLMPKDYFRSLIEQGRLSQNQIELAFAQCQEEYPELYEGFDLTRLFDEIEAQSEATQALESRFFTVAGAVDRQLGSHWSSHIINDISRHCAAHFDQGQAIWASPWRGLSLYEAWHAAAQIGWRMDLLGLTGFRAFVGQMPAKAKDAIPLMLEALEIPQSCWRQFLLCELFSIAGWTSFVKYRVREAAFNDERNEDLIGLIAIRLAYDVALKSVPGIPQDLRLCPAQAEFAETALPAPGRDVLVRYLLQVAMEKSYQAELCQKLLNQSESAAEKKRKTLQMVFCIDVRSEVMRRHLESCSDEIETFGFAGFFGLALEYVPFSETAGSAQCPVLLKPGFRIHESLRHANEQVASRASVDRKTIRMSRKSWKSFQTSAVSCFSFVESLGLAYFAKLLTTSFGLVPPVANGDTDGIPSKLIESLGPEINGIGSAGIPGSAQIDLAQGILRNLGLTNHFGRIVALCGHVCDVVNNPYKAGLDCGACGGHSGEPNARAAVALLNSPHVRTGLGERGIHIPDDTFFMAAVHNTTTDEIRFFDPHSVPVTHAADFAHVKTWVKESGRLCRIERTERFSESDEKDLLRRSRDWSEVRPEWGLAGNAAFVIAPRSRTQGLELSGRTFLHSYDYRNDPDFKTLELIMTAPMIVTNWINLQYYASTVDNRAFGSGNKLIHNVVGQFGVFEGNGGDIMTGLPWQSVHDGKRFQHEPLRLLVVVEAPRTAIKQIVMKHAQVSHLVTNGWLSLLALDDGHFYRFSSSSVWTQ